MPRTKRYCPPGQPVHIIQRGNNRTECFFSADDKAVYVGILRNASSRYKLNIHAWVLMTNHVHLLATPARESAVSKTMQYLGAKYVRYFNEKYARTGTLWEGRFRSCLVESEGYLLACQRYIELNPVRAGMVKTPDKYRWSSFHANALGVSASICSPHEAYLSLGGSYRDRLSAYRALFDNALQQDQIDAIRRATNHGLVFGSERFKDEIERRSGQRTRLSKRGPRSPGKRTISALTQN
jgi:putative transposase